MNEQRPPSKAFSLIEMLVVIAIIVVVVAITIPVLGHVGRSGQRAARGANLRMIGVALAAYRTAHVEFPAATLIPLPWVDERPLSEPLEPFLDAPRPERLASGEYVTGAPWRCPADPGLHRVIGTSYEYRLSLLAMVLAVDGEPHPWRAASAMADAPANSPLVADASRSAIQATKVDDRQWHPPTQPGSRQAVFADGRVESIR